MQAAADATPSDKVDAAPEVSGGSAADTSKRKECPICVMFREGGCETEFNAFMDCGTKGETGEGSFQDCIPLFESMRLCMQRNPAAFGEVLKDVDELARTNTEYPPPPAQPAAQQ